MKPRSLVLLRILAMALAFVFVVLVVSFVGCTLIIVTGDHASVRDIEGSDSDLSLARRNSHEDQRVQRWRPSHPRDH
jgi:alkaline phosphatase